MALSFKICPTTMTISLHKSHGTVFCKSRIKSVKNKTAIRVLAQCTNAPYWKKKINKQESYHLGFVPYVLLTVRHSSTDRSRLYILTPVGGATSTLLPSQQRGSNSCKQTGQVIWTLVPFNKLHSNPSLTYNLQYNSFYHCN